MAAALGALVPFFAVKTLTLSLGVILGAGGFLYMVVRWPRSVGFIALAWIVFEKAAEYHLPVNPTTIDKAGDTLLVVALVWTLLLNVLRRRDPLFTLRPIGFPLAAFVALGVASILVTGAPVQVGVLGILSTAHSMIVFLIFVNIGLNARDVYRFAYSAVAVFGAISLIAVLQVVPQSPAWRLAASAPWHTASGLSRVSGVFEHPNSLGDDLALMMPLALMLLCFGRIEGRKRTLLFGSCSLMLVALLFTLSREAWIAVLVGTLFLGVTVEPRLGRAFLLYILPGFVAVALVFAPFLARLQEATGHADLRFTLFQATVPVILSHLWLGVGPGRFGGHVALLTNTPLYAQYNLPNFFYGTGGQLDMFWTHLVAESGILGTAAFVAIIVKCFSCGRKAYAAAVEPQERALLLGLLYAIPTIVIVSVLSPALESGPQSTLFWALMGLLTVLSASRKAEVGPAPHREGRHFPHRADGTVAAMRS